MIARKLNLSLMLLIAIAMANYNCLAQNKYSISTGFGIYELINFEAKYHYENLHVSLGIGVLPQNNNFMTSLYGNIYLYFGKESGETYAKTWFQKSSLLYLRDENINFIYESIYINLSFGRDFNINTKFGFATDMGVNYMINRNITRKTSASEFAEPLMPYKYFPSFNLKFFYRL